MVCQQVPLRLRLSAKLLFQKLALLGVQSHCFFVLRSERMKALLAVSELMFLLFESLTHRCVGMLQRLELFEKPRLGAGRELFLLLTEGFKLAIDET